MFSNAASRMVDKVIDTLAKTPLPTILVVAGIIFLFLAVGGQLGARFSTERLNPRFAMMLGLILLGCGIWLQFSSSQPSQEKQQVAKVSPAPSAGEAYALRKPAVKGRVIRATTRMDWPEVHVSLEAAGKYSQGNLTFSNETNSIVEVMAVENGRPTVMRIKITADNRSTSLALEGAEPNSNTKKGPLEGASILVELKNGHWVRTLLNGTPTKEQKEELQRQYVDPDEIYPTEKVPPGHTWQLTGNQLLYFFPDSLSVSGNAWCKFTEVLSRQGQQCAVISSRVELVAQTLVQNQPAEFHIGANAMTYRALDKLLDIESNIAGQMTAKCSWIAGGTRTTMEISGAFHSAAYGTDVTDRPDLARTGSVDWIFGFWSLGSNWFRHVDAWLRGNPSSGLN